MVEAREKDSENGSEGLYVFVEPAGWDESKGEKPISEIRVRCENFLRSQNASPSDAFKYHPQIPCRYALICKSCNLIHTALGSIGWTITRQDRPYNVIRRNLQETVDRQFRTLALPEGVSQEKMVEDWKTLNYGSPSTPSENDDGATSQKPEFLERLFVQADRYTKFLRALSSSFPQQRRKRIPLTLRRSVSNTEKRVQFRNFLKGMKSSRKATLRSLGIGKRLSRLVQY